MERSGRELPVRSVVKLPNGTYETLSYNPFTNFISQETKMGNGNRLGCISLPLHTFKTNGPIQDVFPYGFVQLKDRLLAIAFATVRNKKDNALFFWMEDPSVPTVGYKSISTDGEILDIKIIRSTAGNLAISLIFQSENNIGTASVEFIGESIDIDKREIIVVDMNVKNSK